MNNVAPKILIIEDDQHVGRAIAIRLRAAGFAVVIAQDALQAISFWRRDNPALVIMDVRMPAGDGFRVHESLNQLPDFFAPVIYVTGDDLGANEARARELGAAGFLRKPIDFDQLLACIHKSLEGYLVMDKE